MEKNYTAKEIKELFKITSQTLYNWRKQGRIKYKKITSSKFLYSIGNTSENHKDNVIYARVSNIKQKDDLNRQISFIKEYMIKNGIKVDKVYSDIASGMNENRVHFNQLIKDVINGKIDKIYISYKDRLTRFGFSYFRKIFKFFNTEIFIINLTDEKDFQTELTEDLITIIHHFSMKMHSNRRKKINELKNFLKFK